MQVRYCSDNSIDFLVRNRGHGITSTLNRFKGLQIGLDQLQGLQIDAAGQTVLLQGGVYAGPVIANLWDNGFVTSESPMHGDPHPLPGSIAADIDFAKVPALPTA